VQTTDTNGLVVITQLQPITVIFTIPEDSIPLVVDKLKRGVGWPSRRTTARCSTVSPLDTFAIDNQVDPTTGTSSSGRCFPTKNNALFPNQFVNARLLVETQRDATLIPTMAIQRNAQGAFVYLINSDQTVAMHTIFGGHNNGDMTAVEGLKAGDVIAATTSKGCGRSQIAARNPPAT